MSISEQQSENRNNIKGIHIKKVNYIFVLILSAFVIGLFVVSHNIYSEYKEIKQLADEYDRIQGDAKNVQKATDDLTRDVQLFVMRGEIAYLEDYFKEANEVKRREAAIADLKEMNVSNDLVELLEESVEQSMELMQLEYLAMRYAGEGYHIDLSGLPKVVTDVALPAGSENLSDEEKIEKAENLVFGDEYFGYKSRIENYQQQCLSRALEDVSSKRAAEDEEMRKLLLLLHISLDVVGLNSIIYFLIISNMVVNPLSRAVGKIASRRKIEPLQGTYEIKYMSYVYNEFYHDSFEIQKKLKQDAERDSLTGVLNRRGYGTVIETLATEKFPIAFLMVDIDHFKNVNDTYGHETGDTALKKLAHILLETFRDTDIVSRIGGDEFVVIMGGATQTNRDVIEKKAEKINEVLAIPGPDNCPALTVSIGTAFSEAGYSDQVFAEADQKMYEVKRSGGKGIRF